MNYKIALGTAQFGFNYGISNKTGKVSLLEVERILKYAVNQSIEIVDTAQNYGDSEEVLGGFDLRPFKIITKLIGNDKLEMSLKNLRVKDVYGLMFHREIEVNDDSWHIFEKYKSQKMTKKIGVSVYSSEKLQEIIDRYPIDIVQIPLNMFDQRFVPFLSILKKKKIEVYARSIFLQGLLLMNIESINAYFNDIKPLLMRLPKNKLACALNFALSIKDLTACVIGVTSLKELKEIVSIEHEEFNSFDYDSFKIIDEKFINPAQWRLS